MLPGKSRPLGRAVVKEESRRSLPQRRKRRHFAGSDEVQLEVGNVTSEPHASIPSGSVIRTDPPAGQDVPVGTEVDLVLSSGPTPSPTPSPTPVPTPTPTPTPVPTLPPPPATPTPTP